MNEKYYSQAGQDEFVDSFLSKKKGGVFLDIGAYDGLKYSNSAFFEFHRSWTGLCVEPNPQTFHELLKNRKCICANEFVADTERGINLTINGFYSTDSEIEPNKSIETMPMRTIHPWVLLNKYECPRKIDYFSLDVEGMEAKVLSEFPFDEFKVSIITVEHNVFEYGPKLKDEIYNILSRDGFVRVKENVMVDGVFPFEDWYVNYKNLDINGR